MQIDLPPEMRKVGKSDWKALADITADAFSEDPVMNWVVGTPRAIKSMLRIFSRAMYAPKGICHLHGQEGATMWMHSSVDAEPGALDMLQFAIAMARFGTPGALKRGEKAGAAMAAHHPKEPAHMYLFTIGSTKAARGKGIGKALLAPVLEACDRDRVPVYLENSNPANTGFYAAHGFERYSDLFSFDDNAPPMEPMWREPRSL